MVASTIALDPADSAIGLMILLTGIPVYWYWSLAGAHGHQLYEDNDIPITCLGPRPRAGPGSTWPPAGSDRFRLLSYRALPPLDINGDSTYGYPPLQQAIARKCGVDPDCVVAAAGTSMANHLAMAALIEPGDEVLIEQPAYELLVSAAWYFGAEVKRFARAEESGYALDPAGHSQRSLRPRRN